MIGPYFVTMRHNCWSVDDRWYDSHCYRIPHSLSRTIVISGPKNEYPNEMSIRHSWIQYRKEIRPWLFPFHKAYRWCRRRPNGSSTVGKIKCRRCGRHPPRVWPPWRNVHRQWLSAYHTRRPNNRNVPSSRTRLDFHHHHGSHWSGPLKTTTTTTSVDGDTRTLHRSDRPRYEVR